MPPPRRRHARRIPPQAEPLLIIFAPRQGSLLFTIKCRATFPSRAQRTVPLMWMGFLIVEILCFLYFAFSRRRFDLFAVANLGAAFYMLPLFVGRIPKIGIEGVLTHQLIDLDPRIYVFGCAVIVTPTLIGVLYDRLMPAAREPRPDRSYAGWYLLLALIGIVIHASTFETAMCLAILDAFKKRRWMLFALAICLLILDVAVGFRFNLVLVTIGCVLLWLAEKGPV